MSTFSVKVLPVTIENHPDADALECARIGLYFSIVKKGFFKTGELVAYIPEQAVVPDDVLKEHGFWDVEKNVGTLGGSKKNIVKPRKLRGIFSQGLCIKAKPEWQQDQDVAEELGITKYEVPIPAQFSGDVWNAGTNRTVKYDIENIKTYPDLLKEGELIVATEKLHGTWACFGIVPDCVADEVHGNFIICSKGLGAKGLCFKINSERNDGNAYVQTAISLNMKERMENNEIVRSVLNENKSFYILGEVFGSGVQDLAYGNVSNNKNFRVFDVCVKDSLENKIRFFNDQELSDFCDAIGLERVPVIYRGPFSIETVLNLTKGKETVSGKEMHIREGIVIRPQVERHISSLVCLACGSMVHCSCRSQKFDGVYGRVQLKSISEDYLLRKNGTEYN